MVSLLLFFVTSARQPLSGLKFLLWDRLYIASWKKNEAELSYSQRDRFIARFYFSFTERYLANIKFKIPLEYFSSARKPILFENDEIDGNRDFFEKSSRGRFVLKEKYINSSSLELGILFENADIPNYTKTELVFGFL